MRACVCVCGGVWGAVCAVSNTQIKAESAWGSTCLCSRRWTSGMMAARHCCTKLHGRRGVVGVGTRATAQERCDNHPAAVQKQPAFHDTFTTTAPPLPILTTLPRPSPSRTQPAQHFETQSSETVLATHTPSKGWLGARGGCDDGGQGRWYLRAGLHRGAPTHSHTCAYASTSTSTSGESAQWATQVRL
jgi:hypothetical protein